MTLADQLIQEGLENGREEGLEKGQRAGILEALEIRFGEVPEGLREAVESVSGSPRLRELHRAAITAATLEQFSSRL